MNQQLNNNLFHPVRRSWQRASCIAAMLLTGSSAAWAQDSTPAVQDTAATIPATPKARLDLYGFAMLDNGYQFGQNDPDWFDVLRPTKLAASKDQFGGNGHWFASVRQTRFGARAYIPTALGELKTIFEFELFGTGVDAGQTTFRLRHAWGELGKFGGGQTWSTFMDIDVFPNSLEYWGPNGMVFFRNVQFRYTPWSKGDSNIAISAERPGASADQGIYANRIGLPDVKARFPMPDIAGHARWAGTRGHLQVAAIYRKIKWDDTTPTAIQNLSGGTNGWGVNVTSNLKVSRHVLRASVVYGHGVQNYMNDAPQDVGIKNNFLNPLQPIGTALPILGIVGFFDLNWSDKWTSTIGYSRVNIGNSNGQSPDAFRYGQYALTNILWHPVKGFLVGPEYQYGTRANYSDGWKTHDNRIQFSLKYNFSFSVGG